MPWMSIESAGTQRVSLAFERLKEDYSKLLWGGRWTLGVATSKAISTNGPGRKTEDYIQVVL